MTSLSPNEQDFLELVNQYPSPHNGQPIRIARSANDTYVLYFEKSRGLQSSDVSYIFSFVTMGVFATYLQQCADALGHTVTVTPSLPNVSDLKGEGLLQFGTCSISWTSKQPNAQLLQALQFRQTSRKKYTAGVPLEISNQLQQIAINKKMVLSKLSKEQARQAIWLNQRAVFDDMHDELVRKELDHWLRYSKKEKHQKMDGLAYDCMELNGASMKFIVNHPGILRNKLAANILKKYYLRTMSDNSDVFYMLAPFKTESDSFAVGTTIMELWTQISKAGLYLHPFGTIMSNHAAHADFLKLAQVQNESLESNYLVFIFRGGTSAVPVQSLRLPYQQHLVLSEQA